MSNHVHLVFRSVNGQKPELLIGDLKRFTSQSIVKKHTGKFEGKQKRVLVGIF
jgi:REP element-mobilizing transposase RayT